MPLNAGDIAFVGFNADGNDNIAFVALTDINIGEVIIFEDNEWNGTTFVDTNEGAFSWTATTLVSAGTIVRIDNIGTGTIAASTGTAATPVTGRGTNRGIGASGETIYAYQGSATSPTFLTAITNGGFSATNGVLTNTGLTAGSNAIDLSTVDLDADIAAYTGSRTGQANFSGYRSLINNATNWITQDATGDQSIDSTAPDVPFSATAFTTDIVVATPTVTIAATDATAAETLASEASNPGTFRITRTGDTTNSLTVNYTVSGQATNGTDYTPNLTGTALIAAGQSFVDVTITPVDDADFEGSETITLTLVDAADYDLGATTAANVAIADNDVAPPTPTLIISEVHPSGSGNGTYAADWFEVTNTGTSDVDITGWRIDDGSNVFASAVALRGVTTIPAGKSVIFFEGNATGSTDAAIIAAFSTAWFGTATPPAGFLIGAYGGSGVGLSSGGDAVNLFDASENRITGISFGAANSTTTFDNAAGAGSTILPLPTVSTLSATGVNGGSVSFNGAETGSPGAIANSALPTVTIAATDATAAEAGQDPGTFRIARTGALTDNLIVAYAFVVGTGQASSDDYTPALTGVATIAAGQSFVDITITPVDDLDVEGAETLTLVLSSSPSYSLGVATATVTIADNDVSLNAPPTIQESTATPFVNLATTGSGFVSGVINDPTDPASSLGIDFAIADPDTSTGNLTVTVSSSNQAVVSNANLTLSGTDATRNLKITPSSVGFADITVTVSDGTSTANYVINYAASAASVNPLTTRFHTGTSDASTAIAIDADYMLVADDEDQTIRLYDRNDSGLRLNSFDFTANLGLSGSSEVDIEGSTRVGNTIYWTGSHSNNSSGNNRDNRERIFSTTVSGTGANTTLSFGDYYSFLEDDLIAWDNANGHGLGSGALGLANSAADGVLPEQTSGFNIEGLTIAPDGTTAYVSFRAPLEPTSTRTNALIVPVQNFASLIDDNNVGSRAAGSATFGAPIFLDLGGRGIRSIERNSAGEYLIVAGTATAGNDFKLYTWTGNPANAPVERLTNLTALLADGSFESIVEVPDSLTTGSAIQVLVDNGDSVWYNNGTISKDLAQDNFQKFRSETITLGAANIPNPVINEFVFDHTGTDTNEYIEILGAPNTNYSSFSLLVIEGDSGSAIGNIDRVIPLGTTDANGFFVASSNNVLENGTQTLLLVENFTGVVNTDLDTNDDGVLDATPWGTIVDSVAVNELKAGDRTYSPVVLDQFFDDAAFTSTFEPGGASRIPNGTDTNSTSDWVRNDFDLAGITGLTGTPAPGEAFNTRGAVNAVVPVPPGIRIAQSGGNTQVSEAGTTTDTYTIALATTPTNSVTVQIGSTVATAGQVQLSTDGVTFSNTVSVTLSNTTPVTITVRAVDDAIAEGAHTAVLTHTATSSDASYNGITVTDVTVGIQDDEAAITAINQIQGAAHISPLQGQTVVTQGIVTALFANPPSGYGRGFYLQNPNPDANEATSEAIFVFVGASGALPTVGSSVQVTGRVDEFRRANNANNLTVTQLNATVAGASVNAIASLGAIAPTILGNGGRAIPNQVIDNDTTGNIETGTTTFDPAQDGIDFYESVEGMLVQVNNSVATSPTATFTNNRELWVLADNGVNATSQTAEGGSLITATDFNPERIQLDDVLIRSATPLPDANVGAQISTATGVVDYNFQNFEVLLTAGVTQTTPSPITKEVTNLTSTDPNQLTVATFNVENLDPGDGAAQFAALANAIVNNLKSPDIINLEEIQDNNGATNDSVVDASVTFQTLINAIAAAGGPTYEFRQINPVDDTNGGEPGGNIRVGFLFNPTRVDFVDRPGGTATTATTVSNVGGVPQPSASPGLIDPTNSAFNASRKPLVGEFLFNGQTVFVVGNHFNSKGGDQSLFGPNQPPTLNSEVQRNQQATLVRDFVRSILAINPNANVVVAGDLNDFEFSNPLTILEDNGALNTLIETLPANERYTYNFQGNAQTLDHILVSDNLLTNLSGFDVVHFNSEFADQISDHDPIVARFNLPVPNAAPTAVNLTNTVTTLAENTSTNNRIFVADISVTDDSLGTNGLSLSGTDAGFFEIDGNQLFLKANTALNFEGKPSYAVTVNADDVTVGNTPDASTNFTLNLTNVNETPVAVDDSVSTTDLQAVVISVLANDDDVDANDPLVIDSFTNPANGSLVKNGNNTFTYTPTTGFEGSDSFTYTLKDVGGLTSTATVSITVTQGANLIIGTNGNDNLTGTNRADEIRALAGNDTLNGGLAADILKGGLGNDTYIVDAGDVIVENLNEGTDLVRSSISWTLADNVENLTLTGSAAINGTGNDLANVLTGNSASNTLSGLGGNDTLDGQTGNDVMFGGLGDDTYIVNSSGDVVNENLDEGTDLVRSSVSIAALSDNVENLTLTGNNDINGTGNDLANVITGNDQRNVLTGLGGDDILEGKGDRDTLIGGLDNDTYIVNSSSDRTTENFNEGTDLVQSSVSWTLGNNVENLTLTGTSSINGTGNSLDNIIIGNSRRNVLSGRDGNDTLIGGSGDDELIGGSGNDILIGGSGNDTATGNSGNDTFVYTAFGDRTDRITDFNTTQDTLDLSALLDSLPYAGSTPTTDGFLRFTRSGSSTLVQIDQNGLTGGASFSTLVTLNNVNPSNLVVGGNVLV
ncbi:MAG: DUF3616 domain-containing protein [Oculatellaceae cyanobacterium bins.114]|nr:DUF3616 domain-containing protein [Oculatellaceae cyanobacterium bins.114]